MLSTDQVRKRLKATCEEMGSQAEWARQHGMSAAYVNDVINDRREPGQSILDALGLERVVQFRPKQREAAE